MESRKQLEIFTIKNREKKILEKNYSEGDRIVHQMPHLVLDQYFCDHSRTTQTNTSNIDRQSLTLSRRSMMF